MRALLTAIVIWIVSHTSHCIEREEIECGRNFLINSCINKASLLLKMEYGDFMNSLVVRMDVFDDLTYLQKHLRLIIKIHQVSSQSPLLFTLPTSFLKSDKRKKVKNHLNGTSMLLYWLLSLHLDFFIVTTFFMTLICCCWSIFCIGKYRNYPQSFTSHRHRQRAMELSEQLWYPKM
mgnify:FL=1